MANTPVPGYPATGFGKKYHQIIDHGGPKSYPTGGESVNALDFGMGGFDAIDTPGGGVSMSGNFYVLVFYGSVSAGSAYKTLLLKWFTIGTFTEVVNTTDLSAEVVRLDLTAV